MQLTSDVTIEDIPRLSALTRRFTLGRPRNFTVRPDGSAVLFSRARSGTDPVHQLWSLDLATGVERLIVDPRDLRGSDDENLPPEEQARRERLGEAGNGITAYSTNEAATIAAFAVGGQPWVVGLDDASSARELAAPGPVVDPQVDPTGHRVAYVHDRGLWVSEIDGAATCLLAPESDTVSYGLADFAAAEELDRIRGFWWSPEGTSVLCQRTDEADVSVWWIASVVDPAAPPTAMRYPQVGTTNASVSATIVHTSGERVDVVWDTEAYPYLARAWWDAHGPALAVFTRDQRRLSILSVDVATGATTEIGAVTDDAWVTLLSGLPTRTPDGRVLAQYDDPETDTRLLTVDGVPLAAPGLQLEDVLACNDAGVLAVVSADPLDSQVVIMGFDGTVEPVHEVGGPALQSAVGSPSGPIVVTTLELERTGARSVVVTADSVVEVRSVAEAYPLEPRVEVLALGERALRTAVVLPTWWNEESDPLPIIMAPYGGPGAARVLPARGAYLKDQWLAEQGFAVVVCDGRGTPGRGPAWERTIVNDLTQGVLDDQVEALDLVVEHFDGRLDASRVGMFGWSFGGYLSALAVLKRPDKFHAAVAGAPVSDFRLYDTAYTERYLGLPQEQPEVYEAASLLPLAPNLTRPLLIEHGLSDDNVFVAHSMLLAQALFEAGKHYELVLMAGESHRAPAVVIAERQDRMIADFLGKHLL